MTNEDSGGVADATLREFTNGQKLFRGTLPSDPRVFMLTGFITRCQGEFEEGVRGLERALELDPRILRTLQQIALPYQSLRAMPRSAAMWDHALAIKPNDADTKVARAFLELDWKADTRPLIAQL